MKRRGFTIVQLLCVLALVGILAMVLIPIFSRKRENAKQPSCQSNLKQISLGIFQYTQDYEEKYPIINVKDTGINEQNRFGWADAIQPYLKSTRIYCCPDQIRSGARDESVKKPSDRDYTDYFLNRRLAGIEQGAVNNVAATIMLGDGNDGTDAANARYSFSTLPAGWRTYKNSPSHRHLEGANYAFADGHVKWMKPENVTDKKPDGKTYTFAIQ